MNINISILYYRHTLVILPACWSMLGCSDAVAVLRETTQLVSQFSLQFLGKGPTVGPRSDLYITSGDTVAVIRGDRFWQSTNVLKTEPVEQFGQIGVTIEVLHDFQRDGAFGTDPEGGDAQSDAGVPGLPIRQKPFIGHP